LLLTRSADGTWTLIDEDGVTTLDAPPRFPIRDRFVAARILAETALSILWRGYP